MRRRPQEQTPSPPPAAYRSAINTLIFACMSIGRHIRSRKVEWPLADRKIGVSMICTKGLSEGGCFQTATGGVQYEALCLCDYGCHISSFLVHCWSINGA